MGRRAGLLRIEQSPVSLCADRWGCFDPAQRACSQLLSGWLAQAWLLPHKHLGRRCARRLRFSCAWMDFWVAPIHCVIDKLLGARLVEQRVGKEGVFAGYWHLKDAFVHIGGRQHHAVKRAAAPERRRCRQTARPAWASWPAGASASLKPRAVMGAVFCLRC